MTHKVKGIGMSNFNEKEIDFLEKNGNDVSLMLIEMILMTAN